ncbi:MAG: methyltransferase domain-containing protein [Planctomycetota bacterium]|nr:methyltransferase domain-containing protein [Planctomycetota bacterium]
MSDDLLDLPFDQYQRYRLVADVLEDLRVGRRRFTILDVGGRTALLRRFLPRDRVEIVDLEPSEEKGLVLGDGANLPFGTDSVDAVVAFDTLEHVPKRRRPRFVRECHRVARRWVVLAGPYRTGPVQRAERVLREFLWEKLEIEHRYLEEHHAQGLPVRGEVERSLRKLGGRVTSIGHASLQRWLPLMLLSMYMDRDAPLRPIARHLHRFYNELLHAHDHEAPVYRHAIVAALGDAPLPDPDAILSAGALEREAVEAPTHLLTELLHFDAERDVVDAEWGRLAEVIEGLEADLEGHRGSLAEIAELRTEQDGVIEEVSEELESTRGELEGVRKEAAREKTEQGAVIATLQEDLAAHRESIAEAEEELERERTEAGSERETLTADLAEHAGLVEELRVLHANEVEGKQALEEQLAANTGEYEEERETLTGDLAEHAELVEELRVLHASEVEGKQALEELLAANAGEYEQERETLTADLAEHAELVEELRALHASEVEGKQALEELLAANAGEYEQERETLTADLTEHAGVIAELREEVSAAEVEREVVHRELAERTAEQVEVVETLTADLEGHRAVALEARGELAQREEELGEVRAELERVVEDFERQRDEQQQVLEEWSADLEGHRALAEELREEVAKNAAALERAREAAVLERAQQAEVTAALDADLAGHRGALEDLRTELEKSVASVRALEGACGERDRALAALTERLAVADELTARLRATLNDRRENLVRALALRKRRY